MLETFLKNISYTPAGNPSKKDVLRYLDFLVLTFGKSYDWETNEVTITLPDIYKKILFLDLKASHYFTFNKLDDNTYRFRLPKRLKNILIHPTERKLIIKKETVRFMTAPLIDEMFYVYQSKKLKDNNKSRGSFFILELYFNWN